MRTEYSPLVSLFSTWPNLRRADGRALSIYLPARAEGYDARYYDIVFGDLRHRYRERLGDKDLAVMVRELPRLRSYLADMRPAHAAALAAFAETSTGLLEVIKLPLRAEERLEVGELLLAPALRQLEQFPPSFVAVVDKEHALTFSYVLDDLRPVGAVAGRHIQHSRAGGTSALNNQRKTENRARSNLEAAARVVEHELASGAYELLYVSGPVEARSRFESLLREPARTAMRVLPGLSLDSPTLEADMYRHLCALRTPSRR